VLARVLIWRLSGSFYQDKMLERMLPCTQPIHQAPYHHIFKTL
jgi:hypothetical protein